jgi:integrase
MLGITWEQLEKRLYTIKNHAVSNKPHERAIFNKVNEYFMHHPFDEEGIYDFISLLQEQGKAGATINNYAKLLKHICSILRVDYMRDFTYRKDQGSNVTPWSAEELNLLITKGYEYSFRVGVIIQTLVETAMRNTELCELTKADFTGSELRLKHTKAQEIQYVQVLPHLSVKIAQVIKQSKCEYIFGSHKGRLYRDTLNTYIRQVGKMTGVKKDIRAHIIRHSVCTIAGKRNMNLGKVKNFMRHKRIDTTLRYMHLDKEDTREVAETIATNSMTFETLVKRIKDFRDQFPNLPYKISLTEGQDKIVLEVCK